ncbi:hypothetical protein HDU98_010986 [Podochytrium sp. JEL0797]|nr:hypothetical protein HDU98_010986 [Podochytrium sp. JEL0797]
MSANSNPIAMFPPGYIPDYPVLASWDSSTLAFVFMSIFIGMLFATTFNLILKAKTRHTKSVFLYLAAFCVMRIVAFALRGYDLLGEHGQKYSTYTAAQIIVSVGFMPLAEVLTFNVAQATYIIYEMSRRNYIRVRILIMALFGIFGACVTAYVIDFTLNKPFGAKVPDYPLDLWLREIGFNGLFLICIYTLFASLRNAFSATKNTHIPSEFLLRLRNAMLVVAFQSFLMVIKLSYITFRNWKPQEFKQESAWYALSIVPELVFMLFFMTNRWVKVFDDISEWRDAMARKEGETALEEGWMEVRA